MRRFIPLLLFLLSLPLALPSPSSAQYTCPWTCMASACAPGCTAAVPNTCSVAGSFCCDLSCPGQPLPSPTPYTCPWGCNVSACAPGCTAAVPNTCSVGGLHCCDPACPGQSTPSPTPMGGTYNCATNNGYCSPVPCVGCEIPFQTAVTTCTALYQYCCRSGCTPSSPTPPPNASIPPIPTGPPPYCNQSDPTSGIATPFGCLPIEPKSLAARVLSWSVSIAGLIAFLTALYAVFLIVTSSGDPKKVKAGQELFTASVAGLILIILSVVILNFLGVTILNLPSFVGNPRLQ